MNDGFKISDEIAVIKSRTIAEDVVKILWDSNKRNRLYLFGTKLFMPRGQRLRRPIKKIFSFGKWTPEQNQPPQYDEEYTKDIGRLFYRNVLKDLNVYYNRGTNIINISASSPHPYEAALIANTVADSYQKRDREWSSNESANLKLFLEQRLKDKEVEIEYVENLLEQYKRENQIYDLKGNVTNLLNNLTTVESDLNSNNLEMNIIKSQKEYLANQLSELEQDLVVQMLSSINAQLFALRSQVNEKESELVRNATVYGSDHEAVQKTKNNLQNLKQQLKNKTNEMISAGLSIVDPLEYRQEIITKLLNFETQLHQLETKSQQYAILINKYQSKIELLPEKQSYLGNLEREKEVLSNTYGFIRQKMEEARVSMASEPGKVRIINRAEQPRNPISPDIPRNLIMALIIGALIGFFISIFIEYFDNTIRSVEYIEKKKLPILAIIPSIGEGLTHKLANKIKKQEKRKKSSIINENEVDNVERRLITHEEPTSPISESFRSLRTSLMYTKKGTQGSIMVSSPGPGEGKTTTIVNLAITYANFGKKTILIDGDLRKPVIHKVFDGKNKIGLTHYLSGSEEEIENIIFSSEIKNLDVIYNGAIPPNPSELLGSNMMKDLVDKLKKDYDIVLFDAPPVLAVTDSVVLSSLVDQFILVVRFGNTDEDSIDQTLTAIAHVDRSLTGVVFNDLNQNNSYYSKKYYSYNQYYYNTEKSS
jgi:capsular exopolysaccharide synthesis family protein